MARDPVCGMEVQEATAAATSVYEGATYYFCNPGCKKTFDDDPVKYVAHGHGASHSGKRGARWLRRTVGYLFGTHRGCH